MPYVLCTKKIEIKQIFLKLQIIKKNYNSTNNNTQLLINASWRREDRACNIFDGVHNSAFKF